MHKELVRIRQKVLRYFGLLKSKKIVSDFEYAKSQLKAQVNDECQINGKTYVCLRKITDRFISSYTLWNWISDGRLKRFDLIKLGWCWYINKEQVNELVELCKLKKGRRWFNILNKESKNG